MEVVKELISNVGFPIACCIMLWLQMNKQNEMFSKAIDNNTQAINRLTERLGDNSNE